jgi:indole-3-glycerol phosphate synthase
MARHAHRTRTISLTRCAWEGIDAAQQGKLYADAGAAVISCLTEPTWFKGTRSRARSLEAFSTYRARAILLALN